MTFPEHEQLGDSMRGETSEPLPGAIGSGVRPKLLERLRGRRLKMPYSLPIAVFTAPMVRRWSPIGPLYFVGDPAVAREILIEKSARYPKADFALDLFRSLFGHGLLGLKGLDWRRHRRIMSSSFSPRSVAGYAPAIISSVEDLKNRWHQRVGDILDIDEEMCRLAFSIISRTMFSEDENRVDKLLFESLSEVMRYSRFTAMDFMPIIKTVRYKKRLERIEKIYAPLFHVLDDIIDRRISAGPGETRDLLDHLIFSVNVETQEQLSRKEIRDEILTIYISGHDTTGAALTWVWYLLARESKWAEAVLEELSRLAPCGRVTESAIQNMSLTRRFVQETLRLLPVAPTLAARVAVERDTVGGFQVPKGGLMIILPWALQRHRRVWEHPEMFNPERFSPERSAARERLAYMPFGAGPHVCIGQQLAMDEILMTVAALAPLFQLNRVERGPVLLKQDLTLKPAGGLRMQLSARKPNTHA